MIYLSTGGFNSKLPCQTVKKFLNFGVNKIELSGGAYDPFTLSGLNEFIPEASFQVHNYFPPPKRHFVFNLASCNKDVCDLSFSHAKKSIRLAKSLGCNKYSFHAGFLLDPKVSELGRPIRFKKLFNREKALDIFLNNVSKLSSFAANLNINLSIENNVFSEDNSKIFDCDPFLMTGADECNYIISNTPENVGLLVDVAHLKVSANSLGFNPITFLKECGAYIDSYHLSDNNGKNDSNSLISEESWFWDYINPNLDYYSVEVYNDDMNLLVEQYNFVKEKIKNLSSSIK